MIVLVSPRVKLTRAPPSLEETKYIGGGFLSFFIQIFFSITDIFREIVEELENKKTRKKSKKTFYSDLSRNIAVSLG